MAYPPADNQTFHGFTEVPEGSLDVLPAVVTPLVYRRQPFRMIGLPVLATERETSKRLELLRQSLELGTAEYRWSFAPGFAPSDDEFVSVSRALKDPRLRFACELFWFWPESYPESERDEALECLARRATEDAEALWRSAAAGGSVVAAHNLAVLSHMQALSGERLWTVGDEQRSARWTEGIDRWRELAGSAEFWRLVEKRIEQLDEPQLPPHLIVPIREGFLAELAGINAQLASQALARNDSRLARWHADLLRQKFAGVADGQALLERCVRPLALRLEARREEAVRVVKDNPAQGLNAAETLLDFETEELELISRICGATSSYVHELRSALATTVLDAVVRYQRATGDNAGCLPDLERVMAWPLPPELAKRIRHGHAVIVQAAADAPQVPPDAEVEFVLNGRQLAIGPDGVRLDEKVIAAEHLTGFRHARPSSDAAQILVLGWWSKDGEINLGSPPHLPGGEEGVELYGRIVAACDRWLVPGLIERLTQSIQGGASLGVGPTFLTARGLLFPSTEVFETDGALVGYSGLAVVAQADWITITSRTDSSLAATYSLREDWNAVVLPQLIAALTHS